MRFRIKDDGGQPLDATAELEPGAVIFLSRGGTRGSPGSQNQDYSAGLRLILERLLRFDRNISGVWVDSARVQSLPLAERQILFPADFPAGVDRLFSLIGRRMERVGQASGSDPAKGNRSKRIRIGVPAGSIGELAALIGGKPAGDVPRHVLRLPAEDLQRVKANHIWHAIGTLQQGETAHLFDESTDYDLLTDDGERLPPKAVFGLAASAALGFPVQPVNFTGGLGTQCFGILEAAGYRIVAKGKNPPPASTGLTDEDREWIEGDPGRASHLKRERSASLVRAKKAAQRSQFGKLFCERCLMEPVQVFGDADGEACIEVHHHETQVSAMKKGHRTRLEDVRCLCANCHRYVHRQIRTGQAKVA